MSAESHLKSIQTQWVLGLLKAVDLPHIATELLCQGFESFSLVQLAGLSRDEGGAADLFERALDELGFGSMEPTDALKRYAKTVSTAILGSEIAPLEGANRIWQATLYVGADGWHDLDGFIYAASEADSRPQDRAFFEEAILKEARRWASADL